VTVSSKIPIVEDDPALRELIREVLSTDDVDANGTADNAQAVVRVQLPRFV
jgi:DNA-binding response OmpR family regulator